MTAPPRTRRTAATVAPAKKAPRKDKTATAEAKATERPHQLVIGTRLKHARLSRGIHLRTLAATVGCTESFLSKVENDKVRPSLTMLHRITTALGLSIGKLFEESPETDGPVAVMRAGKRAMLRTERGRTGEGINLESLMPTYLANLLEANIHHVAAGGSSDGFIEHQGEEMGYVLRGQLELVVGGQKVDLFEGDSFFFKSHLPHGYRNPGTVAAQVLWVNTPQSF